MLTVRTSPMIPLGTLANRVDQLFESLMAPNFGAAPGLAAPAARFPAVNLWETETAFNIEAELPGFTPEQIDVVVEDDQITIKGRREQATDASDSKVLRRERWSGAFERTITLPSGVNADSVSASFSNGVLTVVLPKPTELQPRRIAVTRTE